MAGYVVHSLDWNRPTSHLLSTNVTSRVKVVAWIKARLLARRSDGFITIRPFAKD
jgi:hypothetical protein